MADYKVTVVPNQAAVVTEGGFEANSPEVSINVEDFIPLTITKAVVTNHTIYVPGEEVEYKITLTPTRTLEREISDIVVTDTLDTRLTFVTNSVVFEGFVNNTNLNETNNVASDGQILTFNNLTLAYKPSEGEATSGTIRFKATVQKPEGNSY